MITGYILLAALIYGFIYLFSISLTNLNYDGFNLKQGIKIGNIVSTIVTITFLFLVGFECAMQLIKSGV